MVGWYVGGLWKRSAWGGRRRHSARCARSRLHRSCCRRCAAVVLFAASLLSVPGPPKVCEAALLPMWLRSSNSRASTVAAAAHGIVRCMGIMARACARAAAASAVFAKHNCSAQGSDLLESLSTRKSLCLIDHPLLHSHQPTHTQPRRAPAAAAAAAAAASARAPRRRARSRSRRPRRALPRPSPRARARRRPARPLPRR